MKSNRKQPIVTLTTDFGLTNHYVAAMKGVILGICPSACLVDVTHELPAYGILSGAHAIQQTAPFFPAGTIHVVVVDPGVGTERRGLLVSANNQHFLAPDNGVLSFIIGSDSKAMVRELTNRTLWRKRVSSTFHGRDLFAPVAGALAAGVAKPKEVGPVIEDPVFLDSTQPHESHPPGTWYGAVLSTDRFGNIVTNFSEKSFSGLPDRAFRVDFGGKGWRRSTGQFRRTFGEAQSDELFAYYGSSGFIEVAVNQASAAEQLRIGPGSVVTFSWL
jgi:S-adenosylmethionine hydrolase